MKKAYVTAFVESILAGTPVETALANLREVLKTRGHERLWSQILKVSARELEAKLARVTPQLSVAKAGSTSEADVKAALVTLGAARETAYDTSVDETLVGGFSLRVGGRLLDKSYKRALITLYEKITN
jgi:F0F1-type ATP synthase delta subunit